ncbi:MAG TPA: c-type cytochrome [Oligoflexia bacterium]|nr:c-type cytochrome [Oligoflexia bacterium]HMP49530.1 c-type cytochrome [Oligoflexia bacterium]
MKTFKIVITFVVLLSIFGGFAFMWKFRTLGFSARRPPMEIEAWAAHHVRDLATPNSIKNLKNPLDISELYLAEARDHFADHCASCHGNNGDGNTMLGKGMYPPPPDLSDKSTQSLTDGEIFNIIKEGIRFTGMPGFGGADDANWKLVAFIRQIPNLTKNELRFMNEINHLDLESDSVTKHDGH